MFRRKPKPQPAEPEFPTDLTKLGLFVHEQEDELRQIDNPSEGFNFWAFGKGTSMDGKNPKERLNERRREAVDECLRRIAREQLAPFGLVPVCLPLSAGPGEPHVRFLSNDISDAKRVLVVFPDNCNSAMGILSLRQMTDGKLSQGSMQELVTKAKSMYGGIVAGNPACLWWDPLSKTAMSHVSFKGRNRAAVAAIATHGSVVDSDACIVPGNRTPLEHVESVFGYVKTQLQPDAKVDFIAIGYSAYAVLKFLAAHWSVWRGHIHAGFLADSAHLTSEMEKEFPEALGLKEFLRTRCRNYVCFAEPLGTFLRGQSMQQGCPVYSSEQTFTPQIVPLCLDAVLKYLEGAMRAGDDEESWKALNPPIPEELLRGEDIIDDKDWQDELRKLNLGEPTEGWSVPGMEKVTEMMEKARLQEEARKAWLEGNDRT